MTWKPAGPYTADQLRPRTRVRTPQGDGSVEYVRLEPPTHTRVGVVSVILDKHFSEPNYTGSIIPAHDVTIIVPSTPARTYRFTDQASGETIEIVTTGSYDQARELMDAERAERFPETDLNDWHYHDETA